MTVLPYHFVPVSGRFAKNDRTRVADLERDLDRGAGHHRYAPGRRSGRVLCRLRTVSPIVVGAAQAQEDDEVKTVEPFMWGKRLAIPASTLRGMISAVAEAASNSALRVLEERDYSYRMPMKDDLQLGALGEVVAAEEGKLALRPLVMPPVMVRNGRFRVPNDFQTSRSVAPLKVYLPKGLVADYGLKTWTAENPVEYGMELERIADGDRSGWQGNGFLATSSWMRLKPTNRGDLQFLVAQTAESPVPRPWAEIPEAEKGRYTRGIVRVMDAPDRDLPTDRHHEVFLPRDPDANRGFPAIPIPEHVQDRFHRLADERTKATRKRDEPTLPYEPVDTPRASGSEDDLESERFRLKAGDLVYFRVEGRKVAELALSSIWRRSVEDPKARPYKSSDFFRAVDPDLVSFGSQRLDGELTMAERLFGFVAEAERLFGFVAEDDTQRVLPALASRLRFGMARLEGEPEDPKTLQPCILRILASPKPPSPALYFTDLENPTSAIRKGALKPIGAPGDKGVAGAPQGRKFYVHQRWDSRNRTNVLAWPWRDPGGNSDAAARMQSSVTPLRDGLDFVFAVDFDNLDDRELGLLLYALRPTEHFMHKIGMGKSLGLGSVQIDPIGLFEVDRTQRYSAEGLQAPRYERVCALSGEVEDPRYHLEQEALASASGHDDAVDRLRSQWRDGMDPTIRGVLERLGEAVFRPEEVSVPLVVGGDRNEKTYEWFVANEEASNLKALAPLEPEARSPEENWPELERLRRVQRRT